MTQAGPRLTLTLRVPQRLQLRSQAGSALHLLQAFNTDNTMTS